MFLQITAYDVMDGVAVLVQTAETTETGRAWTCLVQELARPGAPLQESWDMAWFVAQLVADRAEERTEWHEIVPRSSD